jgi:ssDNA-binding Zn-finger/Zn-ribbon topoisomerase 1
MNLRWLLLDYIDPQLGLSRAQRYRVMSMAHPMSILKKPRVRYHSVWFNIAGIFAPTILSFGPIILWLYLGTPGGILWASLLLPLTVGMGWVVTAWIGRYTWRPNVAAALREIGYDVCPRCGYWLRGLDETCARCPECGEARLSPIRRMDDHELQLCQSAGLLACPACRKLLAVSGSVVSSCPDCGTALPRPAADD